MVRRTERILENIPVGSLGLISLTGCEELGKKVDDYLVKWRHESAHEYKDDIAFSGYDPGLSGHFTGSAEQGTGSVKEGEAGHPREEYDEYLCAFDLYNA